MATTPPLSPQELDRIARKRAGAKLGWFIHATVFTIVNLAVLALSEHGFGQRPWSFTPLLVWGLGLALHGASVWLLEAGGRVHQRMVQNERERLQREQDRRDQP